MSPRLVLGPASHVGRFHDRVTCRKEKGESLSFTEATAVVYREPSWMAHGLLESLSEVDSSGHRAPSPSPFQVNDSGWLHSTKFRKEQADLQVTPSPSWAHMLPQALLRHRESRVSHAPWSPIKPQVKSMRVSRCCASSPQASLWPQTTLLSKSFASLFCNWHLGPVNQSPQLGWRGLPKGKQAPARVPSDRGRAQEWPE